MNAQAWQRHITWAVRRAADGNPSRLQELAQMLADAETATESLVLAGFGADGDTLLDVTAQVIERTVDTLSSSGRQNIKELGEHAATGGELRAQRDEANARAAAPTRAVARTG